MDERLLYTDPVSGPDEQEREPVRTRWLPSDAHIPLEVFRRHMTEADLVGDYDLYTDTFYVPVILFGKKGTR